VTSGLHRLVASCQALELLAQSGALGEAGELVEHLGEDLAAAQRPAPALSRRPRVQPPNWRADAVVLVCSGS
jgi:hypothetical protein